MGGNSGVCNTTGWLVFQSLSAHNFPAVISFGWLPERTLLMLYYLGWQNCKSNIIPKSTSHQSLVPSLIKEFITIDTLGFPLPLSTKIGSSLVLPLKETMISVNI